MKNKQTENTDLRVLVKRSKIYKALTITFSVLTPLPLLGFGLKYPYSICFAVLCGVFFITAVTFAVLMHVQLNKIDKTMGYLKDARDNIVSRRNALDDWLINTYAGINCDEYENLGCVSFARENLVFAAEGKFIVEKDFNGVKGNHLALQIRGTEIVYNPQDYEDVLDYESYLFTINIGYFEDCPLTEENDTGVILPEGEAEGKKIHISSGRGYTCDLDTVETDDIDCGELHVLELTGDSLTVSFKCLVKYGADDVIYGKVKLIRDAQTLN